MAQMIPETREPFVLNLPPIPEDEFAVYGKVYAYPEHADALKELYAETIRNAASEPGTIYYCLARDSNDRTVFHVFERCAGRDAAMTHQDQPAIKRMFEGQFVRDMELKIVKPLQPAGHA